MSRLTRALRRRGTSAPSPGRPEDEWRARLAQLAPGRSLLDVGCMWNVHGAYAFHAAAHGASPIVGLDVMAATPEFSARNAALGDPVRFVQGDVNDPTLPDRLGRFDVVFCSGVLYHMPDPLHTLAQLRRLCGGTLLLTSATIREREPSQVAVFLPGLAPPDRRRLHFWSLGSKLGLDSGFEPAQGYANWFWGFTPSCMRALLVAAGFTVEEFSRYRRVVSAVCRPS